MGRAFYASSPGAKAVFEEANEALGFDLARLAFEGPEAELALTANTQPAVLTASGRNGSCCVSDDQRQSWPSASARGAQSGKGLRAGVGLGGAAPDPGPGGEKAVRLLAFLQMQATPLRSRSCQSFRKAADQQGPLRGLQSLASLEMQGTRGLKPCQR